MRASLVACLFAFGFACSSSSTPKPDAAGAGFGQDCTVVTDTSTECASGVCTDSINMLPTPVCSTKCTADTDCPTGSMGQKCNMKGYCRP
ncbi:MAG TPA: hypothetical protein VGF94_17255 [Kofleriaceae bacterium]|jgi:hypothetical protein